MQEYMKSVSIQNICSGLQFSTLHSGSNLYTASFAEDGSLTSTTIGMFTSKQWIPFIQSASCFTTIALYGLFIQAY